MKPDSELPISILYVRPPPHIIMRTQPLRLQREFVQKDNPRIRTDDYPYNAKRRGVSFSRAFLNAIAPRPSATPDESPDRVGPSCLRWAHLCFFYATRIMPVRVRIDCATAGLSTQAKPLRTASVAARNHLRPPHHPPIAIPATSEHTPHRLGRKTVQFLHFPDMLAIYAEHDVLAFL